MHEFGLIETLVSQIVERTRTRDSGHVESVRLRYGRLVSEEAVRQAFEMLAPGTVLETAKLELEQEPVRSIPCDFCGWTHALEHEDLHNHGFICEDCGHVNAVPESYDLQVLEVTWASNGAAKRALP